MDQTKVSIGGWDTQAESETVEGDNNSEGTCVCVCVRVRACVWAHSQLLWFGLYIILQPSVGELQGTWYLSDSWCFCFNRDTFVLQVKQFVARYTPNILSHNFMSVTYAAARGFSIFLAVPDIPLQLSLSTSGPQANFCWPSNLVGETYQHSLKN
jgi:hypothetical protein